VNASSWPSPAESPRPLLCSSVSSPSARDANHSERPSVSMTSRMRSSEMERSKKVRLSRTVAWNSCTSCVTSPTRRRSWYNVGWRTLTPPSARSPDVTSYKRNTSRASVVLPEPVRPSRPSTRPGPRCRFTSSSTGSFSTYEKETWFRSRESGPSGSVAPGPSAVRVLTARNSARRWLLAPTVCRLSACWVSSRIGRPRRFV